MTEPITDEHLAQIEAEIATCAPQFEDGGEAYDRAGWTLARASRSLYAEVVRLRTPLADERLAAIRDDIDTAYAEVENICAGIRRWKMSIPAKEATDSDLVLAKALNHGYVVLNAYERLRAELAHARAELAKPVRVVVVLNRVRGTVHSITASDDEARRHVVELAAKHNDEHHAATMTVGLVTRPTPDAAPVVAEEAPADDFAVPFTPEGVGVFCDIEDAMWFARCDAEGWESASCITSDEAEQLRLRHIEQHAAPAVGPAATDRQEA